MAQGLTTRAFRKTKSGFPNKSMLRRHPVILWARKIDANTNSVSLFPRPRILDITADRFLVVKTLPLFRSKLRAWNDRISSLMRPEERGPCRLAGSGRPAGAGPAA